MPSNNRDQLERDGPDAVTSDRLLRQAGLLAERDAGTVAAALASFRGRVGLDHTVVATWLGMNPTQLAALGLCGRPDPGSPAFSEAVGVLARRYGVDAERLAEALR